MKFPVFSLLAGNLAFSETSSQLTPPSSAESGANLTFGAHPIDDRRRDDQYQAAARKKPCKGNVLVGTQTTAFTALLRARRELIAQSSSKRTAS